MHAVNPIVTTKGKKKKRRRQKLFLFHNVIARAKKELFIFFFVLLSEPSSQSFTIKNIIYVLCIDKIPAPEQGENKNQHRKQNEERAAHTQ